MHSLRCGAAEKAFKNSRDSNPELLALQSIDHRTIRAAPQFQLHYYVKTHLSIISIHLYHINNQFSLPHNIALYHFLKNMRDSIDFVQMGHMSMYLIVNSPWNNNKM